MRRAARLSPLLGLLPVVLLACGSSSEDRGPAVVGASDVHPSGQAGSGKGPVIIDVRDEPPGANCAAGGEAILRGTDDNKDGILEDTEISGISYVCNGVDGRTTVIGVVPEPPGSACPTGGKAISWGFDDNHDGVLEASEKQSTTYVCNGLNGANGANGQDGLSSLAVTSAEPAGAHCANGGYAMRTGLDVNRDGVLQPGEVLSTSYACNGAAGVSALVKQSPEPVGAHCADGGTRLDAGLDTNGNAVLDSAEITSTGYACNGARGERGPAGPASLTALSNEPPGPNCAAGGQRLDVGPDVNGNGALDPGEIAQTAYVCNATASNVLTRSTPIGPSAFDPLHLGNCWQYGGQQIQAGIDLSGDGALETNEISTTINLCTLRNLSALAPGATCAYGGSQYQWGLDRNEDGVLAPEEITSTTFECLAPPLVASLGAGASTTCAAFTDGTLRCWGKNDRGQVGDGSTFERHAPSTPVAGFGPAADVHDMPAPTVGVGRAHTCATTSSKTLACWGDDSHWQIGDQALGGSQADAHPTPTTLSALTPVDAVAAGGDTSCLTRPVSVLLGSSGSTLQCWGADGSGQLGNGGTSDSSAPSGPYVLATNGSYVATPGVSPGVGTSLGCGVETLVTTSIWGTQTTHYYALCWGVGNAQLSPSHYTVNIATVQPPSVIVAGGNHACALETDGTVECWGANASGQLGDGTTNGRDTAAPVSGLAAAVGVTAGASHTCAWFADGTAMCWGANASGQLGDGTISPRYTPVPVSGLSGVVSMAAGTSHTCAVLTGGAVKCWGANDHGQLGDGTISPRLTPTPVTF